MKPITENKIDEILEAASTLLNVIDEYPDQLVPINKHGFSATLLRDRLRGTKYFYGSSENGSLNVIEGEQ